MDAVAFGTYMNSNKICMLGDRVIAHRAAAEELTSRLERASKLPAGDPPYPATLIGWLITTMAAERIADLVESACSAGYQVLLRDGSPDGALYPASVLSEVPRKTRIIGTRI